MRSQILVDEIERPRVGPMRDIVATIQPEQDEIVRAGCRDDGMRTRSAGDRQDRCRPAPGGVAAVCLPRPAAAVRRARRRSQPRLPRPHRRGAARPRRGRGAPHDGRGAGRRQRPAPRSRRDRRGRPQGRRASGRRAASGRSGPMSGPPPSRSSCPAAPGSGGYPHTTSPRSSRSCAGGRSATKRRGWCSRSGWRTQSCSRWSAVATRRTTESRTRSPGPRRCAPYAATVWPKLDPQAGAVRPALVGRDVGRARRRAPDARRAGAAALADAAAVQGRRPVVGRGPGAPRRAGRPPRADAEPGPRRPRRGAGPVADAAARGRAALLDRFGHGARRHRPGDDPVGDRLVGVVAGAPRASRTATSRCWTAGSGYRPR